MFLLRLESRRQLLKESETEIFRRNLLGLSGTDENQVAHPDTLNYLLEFVPVDELEKVKVRMIKQLIKDKRLDAFRLEGKFRIAIDGTNLFSFSKQHCEHCLNGFCFSDFFVTPLFSMFNKKKRFQKVAKNKKIAKKLINYLTYTNCGVFCS